MLLLVSLIQYIEPIDASFDEYDRRYPACPDKDKNVSVSDPQSLVYLMNVENEASEIWLDSLMHMQFEASQKHFESMLQKQSEESQRQLDLLM